MSRWIVRRGRHLWWAESPDGIEADPFPSWRDAYAYADTRARQEER